MPKRTNQIPFRTDERDQLQKMIKKYRCSPFTGNCHMDHVSFVRDRKTGLYHIILTQKQVEEFEIMKHFSVPEGAHQIMFMIKPTDEDSDYLIFKKSEQI